MLPITEAYKDAIHDSQRYIRAEVDIHFGSGVQTFRHDDYLSYINILEETGSQGKSPIATITANECTLTFNNVGKQFSPGNIGSPYFGQLKPNVKFEVYFIVETTSGDARLKAGTYYTGDWNAPNTSTECTVSGYDRLMLILNKPIGPIGVQKNMSIKALFEKMFESFGLSSEDYYIDPALDQVLPFGYAPSDTFKQVAQRLIDAHFATVFTSKDDKIKVMSLLHSSTSPVDTWTDDNQIFGLDNPVKYLDSYSTVKVKYYVPYIKKNQEIATISSITFVTGDTELEPISIEHPVASIDRIEVIGAYSTFIRDIIVEPDEVRLTVRNTGAEAEEGTIVIYGSIVATTAYTYVKEDTETIARWGEKVLETGNEYVQSKAQAITLATNILKIAKDPKSEINMSARGNPAIELLDVLQVASDVDSIETKISINRISVTYDGAYSVDIVGRIPVS